jgi:hypothetical protein
LRSAQAAKPVEPPGRARRESQFAPIPGRWRTRANIGVLALFCAGLCSGAGCAGQSGFLTGGPTVGQLKTSLSHLEYENEQLKKTTAKLERENRSMEDRLVQEQLETGELTARLDDARNLLRDRGIDADVRVGSHRGGEALGASSSERERAEPSDFSDGSRSRRRKTPFAQISGGDSVAPIDVGKPDEDDQSERPRTRNRRSGRRPEDNSDRQSYHQAPQSWLPVADSSDDSILQIR